MEYLIKLSQIRFEDTKGVIKGQNSDIQNTILSNMNRTKIKKMLRNDKHIKRITLDVSHKVSRHL
jgi:hypothetical protein